MSRKGGPTAAEFIENLHAMEVRASIKAAGMRSAGDASVPWAHIRSAISSSASFSKAAQCAVCSSPAPFQCARCKCVSYCSPEHQKEDWKGHKGACSLGEGGGPGKGKVGACLPEEVEGGQLVAFKDLSMRANGEDVYLRFEEAEGDEFEISAARYTAELHPPRLIVKGTTTSGGGTFEPLTPAQYGARVYSSRKLRLAPHHGSGSSLVFSAPNGAYFTLADVLCCLETAMRHLGCDYSHSWFEGIQLSDERLPVTKFGAQGSGASYWSRFKNGGGGLIDMELTGACEGEGVD